MQAAAIESQLQDQMNHHVAVMRENHVKDLLEVQNKIELIQSDLNIYNSIIDETKKYSDLSLHQHKESSSILLLENILKTTSPFSKQLLVVKNIAESSKDELVLATLAAVPISLQEKGKKKLKCYSKNS